VAIDCASIETVGCDAGRMPAMNSLRTVSSLACMLGVTLALGCNPAVTEAPEDDVGDDSTSDDDDETVGDDESSTSESGTETTRSDDATSDDSTSGEDTADTTDDSTDDSTDDATDDSTDSTTDDSTDDTTDTEDAKHVCGWDVRDEYYWCGSVGVDPSNEYPISCEEIGFPMVPGAPCEEKLGYVGCCDANGDAWYCYEELLEYEICGAG
jgi:hypothetical protein